MRRDLNDLKKVLFTMLVILSLLLMGAALYLFDSMIGEVKMQERFLGKVEQLNATDRDIESFFDTREGYMNYDMLSSSIREFQNRFDTLKRFAYGIEQPKRAELLESIRGIEEAAKQREQAAERYKSATSIINNSLLYLFSLHEEITLKLMKEGYPGKAALLEEVNRLVFRTYLNSSGSRRLLRSCVENWGNIIA